MAETAKLQKPLLGGYFYEPEFQNSEYEMYQKLAQNTPEAF
jgi:hypothetical protein